MTTLHPHNTGLALGIFVAVVHLLWSILVAAGLGQAALNFVFRMHMLQPVFTVAAFSLTRAIGLIILAFAVGYVMGWVFARAWNPVQR